MGANDFDRGEVEEGPRSQPALVEGLTAADYAVGLRALADAIEEGGLPASRKYPFTTLDTNLYVSSAAAVHDFAAPYGLAVEVSPGGHTRASLVLGPNPDEYREGSVEFTVVHIGDPSEQERTEEPAPELAQTDDCGHVRCKQLPGGCERYDTARTITANPAGRDRDGNPLARRSYVIDRRPEPFGEGRSRIFVENQTFPKASGGFEFTPEVVLTDSIVVEDPAPEPVYLELDGVVMKTTAADDNLLDMEDQGWQRITRDEAMSWRPLDGVDDEPAGALTGEPGTVEPRPALPPEARTALADAISSAVALAPIRDSRIGDDPEDLDAPVDVERVDPDDPTSMVLPVVDDVVQLGDGTMARVRLRIRYGDGSGWDERWMVDPLDGAASREVTVDEIAGYPEAEAVRFAKVLAEVAAVSAANNREDAPALVKLDRDSAAQHLADVTAAFLAHEQVEGWAHVRLRKALADFRAAVRS